MAATIQVTLLALLIAIVCTLSITHARPQQFSRPNSNGNQWNAANPQNPFFPQPPQTQLPGSGNGNNLGSASSTTPVPATATTASPAFLACMQRCGTTMEYNPVCGSDGINYHNNARLTCAARCGKNVIATRMGTCSAL